MDLLLRLLGADQCEAEVEAAVAGDLQQDVAEPGQVAVAPRPARRADHDRDAGGAPVDEDQLKIAAHSRP